MADKEECPVIDLEHMGREWETGANCWACPKDTDLAHQIGFLAGSYEVFPSDEKFVCSDSEISIFWFEDEKWGDLCEDEERKRVLTIKKIRAFLKDRPPTGAEGVGSLTLDYEAAEALARMLLDLAHKARLKLQESLHEREQEREKRLEKFLKDKGLLRDFE